MTIEFLKILYNDSLDIEGDVEIAGLPFKRSRILLELEPDEYELAFAEWLEDRKQILLEKADDILEMFDNADRFERLKDAYKTRSIIPFVGAGMSVPSGYPGWTQFLRGLREESGVPEADLEAHFINGEYEEAAQKLYDDDPTLFSEGLVNYFARDRDIFGPVHYLPYIFNDGCIFTTNFDNVLKRIYDQTSNSFHHEMFGDDAEEFAELLGRGKRILLRFHGHCDRRKHRIITKDEYETVYENPDIVDHLIRDVIFRKSLLFLGCSLVYDRLQKSMVGYVKSASAQDMVSHFAFVELKEEDKRISRKKQLGLSNIFPIWYRKGEHDESIEALLLKLA